MTYGAMRQIQTGCDDRSRRPARQPAAITVNTAPTNSNCPISTPTLKNNKASAVASLPRVDDLRRDEDDAGRNGRFNGRPGDMHPAECCPGKRQAMRRRERRDGDEQPPGALHQQHQSEHEQEMIEPGQDVFDPEDRVGPDNFQSPGALPADEAGVHGQDALELHGAVQAHEPREHADPGFRGLREEDGLAVESLRYTDTPALHGDPREKVLRTGVSASVPSGNCGFTLSVVDSSIAGIFQRTS
jgi:hypothetical protein